MSVGGLEAASEFLPAHLADALWRWFTLDERAPGQSEEDKPDVSTIERHLSRPLRLKPQDVLSESEPFRALQGLKELRLAASFLLNTVDERLRRAERSFLPVSRRHGMRTLPYDVVVQIASTIALSYENDCDALEKMMDTLSHFSIFRYCVTKEPAILRLRRPVYFTPDRSKDFAKIGHRSFIVTHLDCGTHFMYPLQQFLVMLVPFPTLTYLHIGTSFDLANLVDEDEPIDMGTFTLQHLLHLEISTKNQCHDDTLREEDLEYFPYHRQTSSKPLQHIMDVIRMPKLQTITVSLFDDDRFHSSCALIDIFGTDKGRRYPTVTDLHILKNTLTTAGVSESVGVNNVNIGKFFRQGFPNIRNLTLGNFNITSFVTIMGGEGGIPWQIENLQLLFDDRLAPRAGFEVFGSITTDVEANLVLLREESESIKVKNVEVVTKYEENLRQIQTSFPQALRVTDQSVLDMS